MNIFSFEFRFTLDRTKMIIDTMIFMFTTADRSGVIWCESEINDLMALIATLVAGERSSEILFSIIGVITLSLSLLSVE